MSKQTIYGLFDRGSVGVIQDRRFVACEFAHCGLSLTTRIDQRTTVRNMEFLNCRINGCSVGPAILEDIRVDGLQTNDLLVLFGTLFRHVTLKGRIGKLKVNRWVHHADRSERTQRPFDEFWQAFYDETDWALDISDAKFKEFEYCGIPSRLIRRNSASQFVVTRERALTPGWRENFSDPRGLVPFMIEGFVNSGEADRIFVAPLDAPKQKRDKMLRQLNELRELGVAEPH